MKNTLLQHQALRIDLVTLFFRLIFGGLFVYYGYVKLMGYQEMSAQFPDYLGIGGGGALMLVIFAELVCGFFIVIGFLTRLAVIPIFITMIVAYFVAHAADPFVVKQLSFVYMVESVVVFMLGSGKYSVDYKLLKK